MLVALALPVGAVADDDGAVVSDPDPARFEQAIAGFERWDAKNAWPVDPILFVGSSSIRMWPTRAAFPTLPVINRGFGGAHISDVLHFFERVVAPYAPRVVVFYCGDNDIAAGKTPQRVLADYRAFVALIHEKFPDTHIVYLPIKPSASRWKHWPDMQKANALIRADVEQDGQQTYVDTATPLLGSDGKPRAELYLADRLHLSDAGYRLWNEHLRQIIANLAQRWRDGARLGHRSRRPQRGRALQPRVAPQALPWVCGGHREQPRRGCGSGCDGAFEGREIRRNPFGVESVGVGFPG